MMNASTLRVQPSTHMVGLSTNSCFFLIFVHGPGSLVPSNTAAHYRELCRPNDPYGTGGHTLNYPGTWGCPKPCDESLPHHADQKTGQKVFTRIKLYSLQVGLKIRNPLISSLFPIKKCHKNAIEMPGHHAPISNPTVFDPRNLMRWS